VKDEGRLQQYFPGRDGVCFFFKGGGIYISNENIKTLLKS
jgi:hypothetical protein